VRFLIYPLLFVLQLAFNVITWLLSPLLALCAVTRDSSRWCVAPGPRQYLWGWLQLFSTWDDGVDAGWFTGQYDAKTPAGLADKARSGSRWAQYRLRFWWLIRNPAYGLSYYLLGFERGFGFSTRSWGSGSWDSGATNWQLRIDTAKGGGSAFMLRAQLFFTSTRYVRLYLGWKLGNAEVMGSRVGISTHINPFRSFKGGV